MSTSIVVNGQEFNLFSKIVPIHIYQLEMWTRNSNAHGNGGFHKIAGNY